jgi:membrane protease YdiL (CAAX protease family)
LLVTTAELVPASIEFFAPLAAVATPYLALLLVMRCLAKRRGHALFASYLPSIGIRPVLYAALSGISLAGIYLIGILGLSLTSFFQNIPMLREAVPIPQSLGELAVFGLVAVIIAPLTEELYWRGLVLDCLQRKLAPWVSALITALLFSFSHALFLVQPAIVGWMATAAVTGFGLLAAFWVQRTHSLRAPVAAHATYNAAVVLFAFFLR